jgi:hypothetical protein
MATKPRKPPWLKPKDDLLERVDLERLKTKAPKLSTLPPEPLPPHVVRFPGGLLGVTSGRAAPANGQAMASLATHELAKATVWLMNR